jgi:hypothetical protein
VPVRPDVTVGYAKPATRKRKPVRKRQTLADIARGPSSLSSKPPVPLKKPKARVKADTGDILKTARPGARHAKPSPPLGRLLPKEPPRAKPKHKPGFAEALKDELEGHGVIAHAAQKAAEAVGKGAVIVSTGGGPTIATRIGTGQPIRGKGGSRTAAILAPRPVKAPKIVGRTLKDLVNFPAQAVPSVYVPAAAAVEAIQGRPARGKKLLHDLPHTDPVAALVTGHPKRALKIAGEHPGFAALEAVGVKGTAGRAVTRAQELAGARPTARAPRIGPEGTNLRQPQSYSRDATTRAIQKATERRRARKAAEIRRNPDRIIEAVRKDPTRMSDVEIRKRMDERVAVNETIRRQNRAVAVSEAHHAIHGTTVPTGSVGQRARMVLRNEQVRVKPTAATTLRAQAITHGSPGELRAYRDELAAMHDELSPSEQLANRALRRELDKAIRKNPDPAQLRRTADAWQAVMEPRQAKLVEHGLLAQEQVSKSPLVPYAVKHMGATHGKPEITVDLDAARRELNAAIANRARVERARLSQTARAGRVQGRAEILSGQADRRKGRAAAEMGRKPQRSLSALERERGRLLEIEAVDVKRARERVRTAERNFLETKRQARVWRRAEPQLLDRSGRPLSTESIRAHMQAHGVKPPTYVTQAPGQRGARNYFVSSGQPPRISGGTRTGAATVRGTFEAHPDVLVEGVARTQGLIDAAEGFGATVREFAHKPTLGKLATRQVADQAARDLTASTGTEWRPVRIQPFAGRQEQLKALLEKAGGEGTIDEHVGAAQPVREALESAVRGEDGPGPWALMPEAAASQLAQHLHQLGVGPKGKALQAVGSGFRRTVLATSPSWMAGNATEGGLRTGLARAGPRSYITARRTMRVLEAENPQAARELAARALSGGHYGMADRTHIRRDSTQFKGGAVLEPMARGLGAFWRAPGPKHAAAAWKGWTDLVFRQLNGKLESQFQMAMLGKALRDSPLMDGHTLKMSHAAVEQAARGLLDTNEQAAFAREVERMYGKYQAFSPDTRWAISTYTPFIAWWLNAVKFVTDVLPRDHPTATTLIAASEQATAEWRKDHGLDLFMKGALPGFLQGSIPLSGGRHQRAPFRYTPFGAFGSPLETVGNAVLPQFSGVLAAFNGEDWKGAKLRKPNGEPADEFDKAKAAAASFIDATVPIVGQAGRIGQKGIGALNPVAPVAPAKKKARKTAPRTVQQDIDAIMSDQTQQDIDKLLDPRVP